MDSNFAESLILINERISKQTRSVRDVVYETLKECILSEHFTPEMQLKERELSEQFGVSTTPIKEAMRRLELEGLVFTRPRKGTYVSSQIMNSLEEISLARSALEGVAARLTATKITGIELKQLENVIEEMKIYTLQNNGDELINSNQVFHQIIIRAARNDYIARQTDALKNFAYVLRKQALADKNEHERAFEEHHLIFMKIASKDPAGAEEAMRNHIRRTASFVKEKKSKL